MKKAIDLMVLSVVVIGLVFVLISAFVGDSSAGGLFLSVVVITILHIGNRSICKNGEKGGVSWILIEL